MNAVSEIVQDLQAKFGGVPLEPQATRDGIPTVWAPKERLWEILRYLKTEAQRPYRMLYDLCAVDERERTHRQGQPESDFTVIYHLLSFERNEDLRIKVALRGESPSVRTVTDLWPAANWY